MSYNKLIKSYLENKGSNPQQALKDIHAMSLLEEREGIRVGCHLYYYSQFYYEQGNLEQAMRYALQGIQTMIHQPYTPEMSKCYNVMGVVYNSMGDSLQALDWYLDALDLIEKYEDKNSMTNIYNNIGCIYDDLKDIDTAIVYFEKALVNMDPNDRDSYTVVLINLAFMYCENEDWEKVSEFCNSACRMQEGHVVGLNGAHLSMIKGMLAYHNNEIDKVKEELNYIIERSDSYGLNSDDFSEILNLMPKLIDIRLQTEIQNMLKILNEIADERGSLDSRIKLLEISLEFYRLIANKEEEIQCAMDYYQLLKEKKKERLKILTEGINMKLQLNQMIKDRNKVQKQAQLYQQRAQTDVLTGLYNRSILREKIDMLFTSAITKCKVVGFLIIDIDDFKQYNDAYGHVAGDECIKQLANVLLRMSDEKIYFLRYGGDEFLGFFYDIDAATIKSMINLIYSEIRALHIEHKASTTVLNIVSVTEGAFIGIPNEGENLYDLIRMADDQLYKGKNNAQPIRVEHREMNL